MNICKKIIEHLYFLQENNLALYDQFTKVYNRNWFDVICKNKYENKDVFVSIIDMNNLKYINDKFGHIAGDKAILKLADLLKTNFETNDSTLDIMRYGGDEFIIISRNNITNELLLLNDGTFSFGTALKKATMTFEDAIILADKYMYNMKSNLFSLKIGNE